MSLAAWQEWFGDHIYRAILVAGTLEGMGLPIPCELLFFPGVHLARQGEISYAVMVLLATLGNLLGGLAGFGVAYWGGSAFLEAVSRWLGIKRETIRKVEGFFARYGQATVFISRFVGLIRTPTIYCAGAARMSPVRFGIYLTAAALTWNSLWVYMVYRFEHVAAGILTGHGAGDFLLWLGGLLIALLLGRYALGWYRKRNPAGP